MAEYLIQLYSRKQYLEQWIYKNNAHIPPNPANVSNDNDCFAVFKFK